ncbi:unnamed protein product [Dovyalis caffra]|uniref:Signal peptidase complex subunit 3 n=1 Tax=Dovyalis caffra TaxID=77055 RepID=A0AAV1RZ15_9ROSI|nr:unnamed protein product [Dovyalis caffra]
MHTFGYRANAVLTFSVTILALICAIASFSDNFNFPSPSAQIQVTNFNWFQKQSRGNDEVSLTMNITADLQSLFTWNTKQAFVFVAADFLQTYEASMELNPFAFSFPLIHIQALDKPLESFSFTTSNVSLWDAIIPAKEHAKFWIQTTNKYRFVDQGSNLRGKEFNMTLHWHVMPKTGKMFADKLVMPGFRFPEEYR